MPAFWLRQDVVMLAIDTNLIVRYLTGDQPQQSRRAKALIDSGPVYVCKTVLLETERVLRSVFGFTPTEIAQALNDFAGLPSVILEDAAIIAKALDWMASGMDFADALHLANAQGSEAFVTFDRSLAKKAKKLCEIAVRVL
jgi:predicted nucleic-acid-binding protein